MRREEGEERERDFRERDNILCIESQVLTMHREEREEQHFC
jgi:hypothetical protein